MPTVVPITDLNDPRLADYRAIKERQARPAPGAPIDPSGEFGNGTFLAEGELVVRLLLSSRFATRSVCLTPARLATLEPHLAALPPGVPVYLLDQPLMRDVVGFDIHRGVLACGERGTLTNLDALLRAPSTSGLVLLEGLTNADNVGAMFRNTAALAGTCFPVVLSPTCCDPLYRKAIRVSMGHALRVPFAISQDWLPDLRRIRNAAFTLVALTTEGDPQSMASLEGLPRPAILLGTEGAGLSPAALALAHRRVRIPMAPGVDSLNVGVAGAIALHRLGICVTRP